jgi:hypothetical protein
MLRSNHTKNIKQVKIFIDKLKQKFRKTEWRKETGVLENKMPTPIGLSFFLNAHLLHMKYYSNQMCLAPNFRGQEPQKTHTYTHTHTHTNKFHRYFIDVFLHNAIDKVCSVHSKHIGRSILASYIDATKIRHIKKKKILKICLKKRFKHQKNTIKDDFFEIL